MYRVGGRKRYQHYFCTRNLKCITRETATHIRTIYQLHALVMSVCSNACQLSLAPGIRQPATSYNIILLYSSFRHFSTSSVLFFHRDRPNMSPFKPLPFIASFSKTCQIIRPFFPTSLCVILFQLVIIIGHYQYYKHDRTISGC